ncbi:MAG: hypothetical protein U0R52_09780 [Solirubrobacterales bacterium]
MAAPRREAKAIRAGECRLCRSFCDKLIEPRGCLEMRCSYLYSYFDRLTARQYVGCMQEVFRAEVDLDAVMAAGGFGGVKATGHPLPQCQFSVERAYEGAGGGYDCVNPRFFDCSDHGPEGLRAIDLRDRLGARD